MLPTEKRREKSNDIRIGGILSAHSIRGILFAGRREHEMTEITQSYRYH